MQMRGGQGQSCQEGDTLPAAQQIPVLIVDDEADVLKALEFRFKNFGFSVTTASSGAVALRTLNEVRCPIVVTDVNMPEMTGVEMLKRIREKDPVHPKVFVITGFSQFTLEEIFDAGADGMFEKPFEAKLLAQTIRSAFESRDLRWGKAPGVKPKYQFVRDFQSLSDAQKHRTFNIGRGGLFMAERKILPEVGDLVGFEVHFARGFLPGIGGTGVVRWVRNHDIGSCPAGFGVEINYINEIWRQSFSVYLDSNRLVAYIPRC